MTYNPYPTRCNICGGPVLLKSDYMIYGRRIGPGSIYSCSKCGARVGTHPRLPNEKNKPPRALGVLADEPMRELRIRCHGFFDTLWRNKQDVCMWQVRNPISWKRMRLL
jgi:DNA-directed RNA polymerase subunit RPC12/RpoP